jgi:hypothetical protein
MNITFFWNVTLCGLIAVYWQFITACFHLQDCPQLKNVERMLRRGMDRLGDLSEPYKVRGTVDESEAPVLASNSFAFSFLCLPLPLPSPSPFCHLYRPLVPPSTSTCMWDFPLKVNYRMVQWNRPQPLPYSFPVHFPLTPNNLFSWYR